MPFSAQGILQMLDSLDNYTSAGSATARNSIGFVSLHTAYSATGASEVTGGSPAYARKAITWNAASTGSKASSSAPQFDVPGGTTVAFVGLWDVGSGGTSTDFAGMGPNGGATQFAFTADATTDVFTAPGSAYTNGQTVVLFAGAGATLPIGTGISAGAILYIVSASGATFKLSTTSGGTAIDVTAAGAGIVQGITLETYGAQGTFTLNSDTLTIV